LAQKTDIRLRRSNVAGAIPGAANLSDGELAMNTMDGALYFKKSDGTIITAHDNTIMHIDSGNDSIGIGTTSPSAKLDVNGSIEGAGTITSSNGTVTNVMSFSDRGIFGTTSNHPVEIRTNNTEAIRIDTSGNVGIGTTNPADGLEISRTNPKIRIRESDVTNGFADILYNSTRLRIRSRNDATNGGIAFEGQAGSTVTEYARFNSSGNLGIGTTNPGEPLHIVNSDPKIKLEDSDGTNQVGTLFQTGSVLKFQSRNDTSHGIIAFQGYNGTTGLEYARFNASGNLGIGTGSPSSILHVSDASSPEIILEDSDATSTFNITAFQNAAGNLNLNTRPTTLKIKENS